MPALVQIGDSATLRTVTMNETMRILITGAKGNFPTALIPMLEQEGHELVLLDIEPIKSDKHKTVQADVRDAGAITAAMVGCDAVIHAMAYHGNMAGRSNYDDYYGVNVTGTHNILIAMLRLGIQDMVFSSSEVVYGDGMKGRLVMDESTPCIPIHIYPLTKVLCEEMCRFYVRQHQFRIASLRYGCFVPEDWRVQGLGRLGSWLDREDVAESNRLALSAIQEGKIAYEAFLIHCAKPFVDTDWPELREEPEKVVERYYPGSVDLLARNGLKVPKVWHRFDISKAESMLGYRPKHNFAQFLDRLRAEGVQD